MKKNNTSSEANNQKSDFFSNNKININYLEIEILKKFITSEGKILPSRRTGLNAKNQRLLSKAVKKARLLSLLPFCDFD